MQTDKFLKEVVAIVIGKQIDEIVDLLNKTKNVNEFLVAKKLDITVNQTRNILYKLSNHGLVSSIRKKDEKKGWYTYFWKIEVLKTLLFLEQILLKKIEQLKNQIRSREKKLFYFCERCNIEFNDENALLNNFTCAECGNVFALKDNSKVLKEFKKDLIKTENKLKLLRAEISIEKEKLEKKRLAEVKVKERKKKKERKKTVEKKTKKKIVKKKKLKKKIVKKKKKSAKKKTKKKVVKKRK